MSWGLVLLLIIVFICLTALIFLNISSSSGFVEVYFIVAIVILFIILLFTIDFDNPVSTSIYIRTANVQNSLIYEVPYNADAAYSNLISVAFAGTYGANPNTTPASDTVIFNYDDIGSTPVYLLPTGAGPGKITITKLPNWQLQVDIDPTVTPADTVNGFLTMNLLCTGSQSINNKFKLISS
jgi:hypothetical protein